MYDVLIIGGGPAGLSAAIYATRKGLKTALVTENIGGQTLWSAAIQNYMGFELIAGAELVQRFRDQVKKYPVDLKEGERVREISIAHGGFSATTAKNSYSARSLILATGRRPRRLGVKGEEKYVGKGVSYCVTCDGPVFAGKEVAVIGGGNSAIEAVIQLMSLCPKVHLININDVLEGDHAEIQKIQGSPKVRIINSAKTKAIKGAKFVSSIVIEHAGKEREIPVKGVFIETGSEPSADYADFIVKNREGEIVINCKCETSVAGIFAAGDVTDVPEKQIIIAAGEGAKAAISAFRYLSKL
ncbi:MAG: FAD-dependent oxidoreductase [Candidatus Micrarchaeota archaeon]|nr:FAD-dependent oxidoreductase [Candidatus Micrarchaeota archaeon]